MYFPYRHIIVPSHYHPKGIRTAVLQPRNGRIAHHLEVVGQFAALFVHEVIIHLVPRVRDDVREGEGALEVARVNG